MEVDGYHFPELRDLAINVAGDTGYGRWIEFNEEGKMETIMNDKDSKRFLEDMIKLYPKHKEDFNSVVNLITALVEEITEEREGGKLGKKFEKMWKEHKEEVTYLAADAHYKGAKILMDRIEQKYFPGLVKKTISIEIEAKDEQIIKDQFQSLANQLYGNRENIGYKIEYKEGD